MNDLSGQTLKGYEIRERIGVGGFGSLPGVPARHHPRGRHQGHPPAIRQPTDFIRASRPKPNSSARLEHFHIVPLYDYWRDPDGAYLVMRYLRGGSLKDRLAQDARSRHRAAPVEQIAAALAAAHRHGVIHRPQTSQYPAGRGLQRLPGRLRHPRCWRGHHRRGDARSLNYASPEQIKGEAVTPRPTLLDGAVLYEMLTGNNLCSSTTPAELIYNTWRRPSRRCRRGARSAAVDHAVIQRATAKPLPPDSLTRRAWHPRCAKRSPPGKLYQPRRLIPWSRHDRP